MQKVPYDLFYRASRENIPKNNTYILEANMSDGESSDGEVDFRPTLDIESLPKVPVLNCFSQGFNYIFFECSVRMCRVT